MKNKLIISVIMLLSSATFFAQKLSVGNINDQSRTKIVLNFYSFNNPLVAAEMSIYDVIDYAASIGYEGLDITGYYFKGYPAVPTDEVIYSVKRRAFKRGIEICGTGIKNKFTQADSVERRKKSNL